MNRLGCLPRTVRGPGSRTVTPRQSPQGDDHLGGVKPSVPVLTKGILLLNAPELGAALQHHLLLPVALPALGRSGCSSESGGRRGSLTDTQVSTALLFDPLCGVHTNEAVPSAFFITELEM